ncbi:hypothetical protein I7I50_00982 [Histoplasma capsulatum G186AR]|uniref:Uncharacterized protein n=1 Tax=Ajellomyces capsulatus TaxID=5037 RepID=A0A8H7YJV6_AJECA|nr:hypothetical protein I7I52_08248 [Histoplasma capsulatum]QSS72973.1 hypothetical protein I7I50_00982 [Histoplasma capsulatum G186AR]
MNCLSLLHIFSSSLGSIFRFQNITNDNDFSLSLFFCLFSLCSATWLVNNAKMTNYTTCINEVFHCELTDGHPRGQV